MESYRGIKFEINTITDTFPADGRLRSLNHWAYIFSELGLAPVHSQGAFGNHSYRDSGERFVITRTGMVPQEKLVKTDYCRVRLLNNSTIFEVEGLHQPSSECHLHQAIYACRPEISVVMHGHSSLMTRYARELKIPTTKKEYPYGTAQLAASAVALLKDDNSFIILKNHGFVAIGKDIDKTAAEVLRQFVRLIQLFS